MSMCSRFPKWPANLSWDDPPRRLDSCLQLADICRWSFNIDMTSTEHLCNVLGWYNRRKDHPLRNIWLYKYVLNKSKSSIRLLFNQFEFLTSTTDLCSESLFQFNTPQKGCTHTRFPHWNRGSTEWYQHNPVTGLTYHY